MACICIALFRSEDYKVHYNTFSHSPIYAHTVGEKLHSSHSWEKQGSHIRGPPGPLTNPSWQSGRTVSFKEIMIYTKVVGIWTRSPLVIGPQNHTLGLSCVSKGYVHYSTAIKRLSKKRTQRALFPFCHKNLNGPPEM